jgi:beta-glucosidase
MYDSFPFVLSLSKRNANHELTNAAYTTFAYSSLDISVSVTPGPTNGSIVPGGPSDLFESIGSITATITNNGSVTGSEIAQLYIGLPSSAPSSPPKQLRGFDKLQLSPGASGTVTFDLVRRDLSYWNVVEQAWVVPSGTFSVYVGSSSRNIRLTGSISSSGGSSGSSTTSSTTSTTTSTSTSSSTTKTSSTSQSTTLTTTTTTTTTTRTTTTTSTTTSSATGPAQTEYGQCGGIGYSGPTTCQSPYTCQVLNPYYSQCLS